VFTFNPVTREAKVSFDYKDAGTADTHTATFRWSIDSADRPGTLSNTENVAPDASGTASDSRILPPGCYTLTVTGTVRDDDGTSTSQTIVTTQQADAYGASFQAPIKDNERNLAKAGNVVPVKVTLTSSCSGATVTTPTLYVQVVKGIVPADIAGGEEVITTSVSSADTGTQMRTAGEGYMYNLSTKPLTTNQDYTVRIRLGDPTTGPIILTAVLRTYK
jgi:hypothetical protein